MPHWKPKYFLPPWARVGGALANVVFGWIPSLLFFIWVERNASLPVLPLEFGWPWVDFATWPVPALALWNLLLISLFGAIHSGLAQEPARRALQKLLPPQLTRSAYVIATGFSLFLVMALWQNTGELLWVLPVSHAANTALSIALFAIFGAAAAAPLRFFDPLHFAGFRQLYRYASEVDRNAAPEKLITQGIYSKTRHPVYLFTLAAFAITPILSLDRAIVTAGTLLYLAWAIPVEERKLMAQFGQAYSNYRKKVPALFPGLPFFKS